MSSAIKETSFLRPNDQEALSGLQRCNVTEGNLTRTLKTATLRGKGARIRAADVKANVQISQGPVLQAKPIRTCFYGVPRIESITCATIEGSTKRYLSLVSPGWEMHAKREP